MVLNGNLENEEVNMPRYAVFAAEHIHKGNDGVQTKFITKVPRRCDAVTEAVNESLALMHSYASIEEALREQADELYPEDAQDPSYYDFIMDEIYRDNVLIYVHRLNPKFTRNMSLEELDKIIADMDYQKFVSLYCFKQ